MYPGHRHAGCKAGQVFGTAAPLRLHPTAKHAGAGKATTVRRRRWVISMGSRNESKLWKLLAKTDGALVGMLHRSPPSALGMIKWDLCGREVGPCEHSILRLNATLFRHVVTCLGGLKIGS